MSSFCRVLLGATPSLVRQNARTNRGFSNRDLSSKDEPLVRSTVFYDNHFLRDIFVWQFADA